MRPGRPLEKGRRSFGRQSRRDGLGERVQAKMQEGALRRIRGSLDKGRDQRVRWAGEKRGRPFADI